VDKKSQGVRRVFQDHMKSRLIGRLHAILDEAAHVPDANNSQLIHEIVKEAVRYGGVVREGLPSQVIEESETKGRFWHRAS
jgi:hypothetical protein